MATISVYSRAHRTLRGIQRFHFVSTEPDMLLAYRPVVDANEALGEAIGVYKNPIPVQPEAILVAEGGLLAIRPSATQQIVFSELASIRGPSAAENTSDICLTLRSGIVVNLRVGGKDGRFRDVFSFVRFLSRVLEDRDRTAD
jgi:hypothetical protein